MSIDHLGYAKFVEFFLRKGAHFGTYFVLGGSLFLGVFPKESNMTSWNIGVRPPVII